MPVISSNDVEQRIGIAAKHLTRQSARAAEKRRMVFSQVRLDQLRFSMEQRSKCIARYAVIFISYYPIYRQKVNAKSCRCTRRAIKDRKERILLLPAHREWCYRTHAALFEKMHGDAAWDRIEPQPQCGIGSLIRRGGGTKHDAPRLTVVGCQLQPSLDFVVGIRHPAQYNATGA